MVDKPVILLIDDEENLRRTLALILEREGYDVDTAATVKEARQRVETASYDLVFLDLKLPDANGLTLLPELRSQFPYMPVLILTAHDKLESAIEAVRNGASDYLLKPIDPQVLIQRVKDILSEGNQPHTAQKRYIQLKGLIKELHIEDNPPNPPPVKPVN
jgi:DNA-binding response OmpR family regulator